MRPHITPAGLTYQNSPVPLKMPWWMRAYYAMTQSFASLVRQSVTFVTTKILAVLFPYLALIDPGQLTDNASKYMEHWSIAAELDDGEPFGILVQYPADTEEAIHIAKDMLQTGMLTGAYFPCGDGVDENPTYGLYLISWNRFEPHQDMRQCLARIWAENFQDAYHRFTILKKDAVLCCPQLEG